MFHRLLLKSVIFILKGEKAIHLWNEKRVKKLDKNPINIDDLFPVKMLAPGENILIPLEIFFQYDSNTKNWIKNTLNNKFPENTRDIKPVKIVSILNEGEKGDSPRMGGILLSNLKEFTNKPKQNPEIDKEFIFRTSISIESVEINGVKHPTRKYDKSKFIIYKSNEQGSCPYAYTYSPEIKQWISDIHILYGKSSKRKEGLDSIKLKRFTGKVIIKENDPEVSFIDFLCIRVKTDDEKEEVILPKQSFLHSEDQQHLKMKQGEQIEVEFDGFQEKSGSTFYLESKGYYEVLGR